MSARLAPRRVMTASGPRSKYGAVKTTVDGIVFHSKLEARQWSELRLQERGGLISNLERQVSYCLKLNGILIANYVADFRYQRDGVTVVADSKGVRTPVYRLKKKLMQALYGIEIQES